MNKSTKEVDGLDMPRSKIDDAEVQQSHVFGDRTDGGPDYRNVGWLGTVALMMKTQIGLGILTIPASFHALGLIPGIILLCFIAVLTGWASHVIGTFKHRHFETYGIDDAARLLFGRAGFEVFGCIFVIYWIFIAGSAMLGISIGLNAVSAHGACTAVFVAVAAAAAFGLGSIRTLGRISWLAWIGLASILTAVFTVTIAVGVQDKPTDAPDDQPWKSDFQLFGSPRFVDAATALSGFVFAYAGVPAYFSLFAEMRDPRHYTRSVITSQCAITATYIVVGTVVYYFCGSYVATPALGSAGGLLKKVSYGLALPGLLVSATLFVHIPAKYLLVRVLRDSKHLTANTMTHWLCWIGCTLGITIVAYIVASAIPIFGSLTSLIGSLFGCLMSFMFMGFMWFYDNWSVGKAQPTNKWRLRALWAAAVVLMGAFLMVGGTYGSIVSIMDSYSASGGASAWSCADNSNSS
ncbi:transmembrane amino acid transporter protein-domain-containing protein [Emericellopsis atlantica]|uniref:Transmembrane amino acid transporter protein-domain-containing protein n=1 Tax=Emericellopsis atlantica TaxID=2614577 RepID=A0A9P8CR33_9HYPO|nr:transmembrane amino acid transporter protein-domain-containing protein [Emericellopsis atlantica]KAG9254326.1 transmembrane amino acid transporter protein-domain-containing protein [Emericellopsis atlantica]